MDEQRTGDDLSRRRAVLRALPTPVDVEMYVDDAPPLLEVIDDLPEPRIADLDALLREVDGLRSSIRRDLALAATAAEAGADDLAGWLLIQENGAVRSFEERALAHLHDLEAREPAHEDVAPPALVPVRRRFTRMMPAAPLVAACAAVFGFLTIPTATAPSANPSTSNVALQSYAELTRLATGGASDSRITAAAERFHADLAPLVAAAHTNPAAAEKAIALLQSERAVLAAGPDSPALLAVLRQADALVAKLRAGLPRRTVRVPLTVPQVAEDGRSESSRPKASTAPKPSASPSASPKPSASPTPSASPRSTSSPKPSPSESNPLPTSPLDR